MFPLLAYRKGKDQPHLCSECISTHHIFNLDLSAGSPRVYWIVRKYMHVSACVCVQESLKIPILLLCADKLCYEKLPGQTAGSLAWLPDWVVEGKETGKGRRKEGRKSETTPKFPKFSGRETSEHPVKSVHSVQRQHNPATPALSAIYSLIIWLLWSSATSKVHLFINGSTIFILVSMPIAFLISRITFCTKVPWNSEKGIFNDFMLLLQYSFFPSLHLLGFSIWTQALVSFNFLFLLISWNSNTVLFCAPPYH